VDEGTHEIRLSSQDLGIYGFDRATTLIELMEEIVKICGDFKVRLGMMNPQYVFKRTDEIIRLLKHQKLYKFLHIPLQSGSNKLLTDMNRPYTRSGFIDLIFKLRENIPELTIATDIIVGYPTESDEDFTETISLIEKTKPDIVNISKYHHRPGTQASLTLHELPPILVTERTKILSQLCEKISKERNTRLLQKTFNIFLVDMGTKGGLIGRTSNYKKVLLKEKSQGYQLGDKIRLKIIEVSPRYLTGTLID
jgi:MiaB/RimO family radical SAM methylthiotransferase